MKLWLRKLVVAVVAVVTLGFYIPPLEVATDADDNKDVFSENSNSSSEKTEVVIVDDSVQTIDDSSKTSVQIPTSKEEYIQQLTEQAKEQTFLKFGSRIIERVEDEFITEILPSIEKVIASIIDDVNVNEVKYFTITEQPASGLGERIFHVTDIRSNRDIIHFHVRREKRPLDGNWFNFHYHLREDNFETHHHLGDIYWDKNDPPKWMS